jgi:hypothetical protein
MPKRCCGVRPAARVMRGPQKMTTGGWPPAGKAPAGDDHSLAHPGFSAGVPPDWNVIRAPKAALNPVQAVLLTVACRPVRP